MTIELAGESGTRRLYHYQGPNLEWLEDIVVRRRIFLSNPSGFNDPWDCRPEYDADGDKGFERNISFFLDADRKHFLRSEQEHRRREEWLRSNPAILKELIRKMSETSRTAISKQYRVYCLSTNPFSHPMWAHYADKHRGLCLEFGANNDVFSGAFRVHYEDRLRPLDLCDESVEGNLLAFLRKPADYEYENEYRLVSQERRLADPPDTLLTDDGYLAIPVGALRRIIIGCEATNTYCSEVRRIVKGADKAIGLSRALRVQGQYDLMIGDMHDYDFQLHACP